MKEIRVVIVDDERLAREELIRNLAEYPDFAVIGEAANAEDAEAMINSLKPDLVFLDIQMPGRTGLDLLNDLVHRPEIIFVTAYNEYALQAFESQALDYLVKPVRQERLQKSVARLREIFSGPRDKHQQFFVKEGDRWVLVKTEDIYRISSAGNYAKIYVDHHSVLIRRSLNQLEEALNKNLFFRINRNEIINVRFIRELKTLPKGRLMVCLRPGDELTLSARQSTAFRQLNLI